MLLLPGTFVLSNTTRAVAARRPLPMVPEVYQPLKARYETQGRPGEGWVFPTAATSGHMEESSAKQWHAKALKVSKVKPFEPYCLRHTFGTRMAPKCDVFALARIMGHSNIAITRRYVHPQAEAIELAFQKLVTDGGHPQESLAEESPIEIEVIANKSKG
jgi:integrase